MDRQLNTGPFEADSEAELLVACLVPLLASGVCFVPGLVLPVAEGDVS